MTFDVSLTEAKRRLSDLVALVEQSLALLLAAREGSRPGPEALRDLIDDGRRR